MQNLTSGSYLPWWSQLRIRTEIWKESFLSAQRYQLTLLGSPSSRESQIIKKNLEARDPKNIAMVCYQNLPCLKIWLFSEPILMWPKFFLPWCSPRSCMPTSPWCSCTSRPSSRRTASGLAFWVFENKRKQQFSIFIFIYVFCESIQLVCMFCFFCFMFFFESFHPDVWNHLFQEIYVDRVAA